MSNTEQAHGHWSDRFTKAELVKLVTEMGTRRNPTMMKDVAYVLQGGSVAIDAGTLADEVVGYAYQIAVRKGAYDDAAILGDVADCLREIEEEYATNMNLPAPRHDGTCEHGHPNCNPTSDKCGDECD
jgi:hypothetical protein